MNKLVRKGISILLSMIILVSGSGLIIGKMVCLKSGYTVLSAKEAKDCCDDENHGAMIDGQCCDIINVAFHQNNFVHQDNLSLQPIFSTTAVLFSDLPNTNYLSSISQTRDFHIPDPPILISGSSSLPLLGIFRI